ncbi:carboxypeptidase-like regulatory domain-containing protein [Hydrocarboniphaga sp.]|uniref:carboxypeptidase-like regulatory domain-containing protein n=1 Tax=Hydrocarboniphaga sp. TaxID=2033016 RepID=UPI003D148D7B
MKNQHVLVSALLCAVLAACGGGGGSAEGGDKEPSVSLSLSPSAVLQGATSTLSWTTSNVGSCVASGAWSGSRAVSGSESVSPAAAGALIYTLTCNGDAGSASASATLTVSPSSVKQSLTLTGFVTVAGTPGQLLPGASVVIAAGSDSETTTTDASGAYSVTVEVDDPSVVISAVATAAMSSSPTATHSKAAAVAAPRPASLMPQMKSPDSPRRASPGQRHTTLDAKSVGNVVRAPASVDRGKSSQPQAADSTSIKLSSILGSFADLKAAAGDATADSSENIRNNITQLSTAEAVLVTEANDGAIPANGTQLDGALTAIKADQQLQLAGTLKLIIQDSDYPLPAGAGDTLAFASSAAVRDPYIDGILSTDQGAADLQAAIDQTLADPQAVEQPSAASVPASLLLSQPVASNPVGYGNYQALATAFTFAADGTGTYANSSVNTSTHWAPQGTAIHVTLDTPDRFSYTTVNAQEEIVDATDAYSVVDLVRTGDMAYAATFSGLHSETPVDDPTQPPTTTAARRQDSLVSLMPNAGLKSIAAESLVGLKWVAPIFRVDPVNPGFGFQGDVLDFASGGVGSARYLAQSFIYTNDADGALKVTLADGAVLSYYRYADIDAAAGYWLVDYVKGGVHRVDVALAISAPLDLHYTDSNAAGTYYLFGYGDESADNATLNAGTTGFAQRLLSNHTAASDYSSVNNSRNAQGGANRVWSVDTASGSLLIRSYYDVETGEDPCDPAASTCVLYAERELIPIQVSADGRWHYVIEHRRFGDGPDGEITPTTPDEYLTRLYEVQGPDMISGSWELVSYNGEPSSPHADIFSFFSDGSVIAAINDQDPSCANNGQGLQLGRFEWPLVADLQNLVSGPLSASLTINQPGDGCGLGSALKPGGVKIQLNGLGELVVDDGGDISVLRRVPGAQDQLSGSWLAGAASEKPLAPGTNPAVISFFADGRYVLASVDSGDPDCADSGVEYGQYSFDASKHQLSFHDLTLDTSTCGAVDKGDTAGVFGAQVERNRLQLSDDGDLVPFLKLSAP